MNLLLGIFGVCWEWPLSFLAGTALHRSIEARLIVYPLSALVAVLLYQGTNAALYYLIGMGVYFWAYSEGEVSIFFILCGGFWTNVFGQIVCAEPWTLPKRGSTRRAVV